MKRLSMSFVGILLAIAIVVSPIFGISAYAENTSDESGDQANTQNGVVISNDETFEQEQADDIEGSEDKNAQVVEEETHENVEKPVKADNQQDRDISSSEEVEPEKKDNNKETECEHIHTSGVKRNDDDLTFEAIDNEVHGIYGAYVCLTYCRDCETWITLDSGQYNGETELHQFDENGVCTLCGRQNTCQHNNEFSDPFSVFYDENSIVYEPYDNKQHIATGLGKTVKQCFDCGQQFVIKDNIEITELYYHGYNEEGICQQCHYHNTCAHEHIDYSWTDRVSVDYESLDNHYHHVQGTGKEWGQCADCSSMVVISGSVTIDKIEAHVYDQNGVCTECGHINTCTEHESQNNPSIEWDDVTPVEDIDDNYYHRMVGTASRVDYCSNCGERMVFESGIVIDKKEKHSYENGVCTVCGHVNTCDHNEYADPSVEWDDVIPVDDVDDNYNHRIVGMGSRVVYCLGCGNREVLESNIPIDERQKHDYGDGVCGICGHQSTCEHESLDIDHSWFDWGDGSVEITSIDSVNHNIKGIGEEIAYCLGCGSREVVNSPVEIDIDEPHDFNESGVCKQCGYKRGCEHPNLGASSLTWDDEDVNYEPIDNKSHQVSGLGYEYAYCPDCGEMVITTGQVVINKIEHHFYGEDGECVYCHHQNSCEHNNLADPYDSTGGIEEPEYFDQDDNLYHKVACHGARRTYCFDCGENIVLPKEENFEFLEYHSYDENGICTDCGHENTCDHSKHGDESIDWIDEPVYEVVDNRSHIATGRGIKEYVCLGCGMPISDGEIEEISLEQEHAYDNRDICMICGYQNQCEHPSTEKHYSYDSVRIRVEDANDNKHLITTEAWEDTCCTECGQLLDSGEPAIRTLDEGHAYVDGTCSICDHMCSHSSIPESGTIWNDPEYEAIDDSQHSVHTIGTVNAVCPDCGLEIDDTVEKTDTESHVYNADGICERCRHTCTHHSMSQETIWNDPTYEEIDDQRHTALRRGKTTYVCPDCGYSRHVSVQEEEEEEHTYKSGVCTVCNHACTHINKHEPVTTWNSPVYEEKDDSHHTVITIGLEKSTCLDCGMELEDSVEEYEDETHVYDSTGICEKCDHACGHANRTEVETVWDSPTYEKKDDSHHRVRKTGIKTETCLDCGREIKIHVERLEDELHTYVNGKCQLCHNEKKLIGWQKIGNNMYYYDNNGKMVVNAWKKDGNSWYYLKSNGAMATGWQKIGGTWYYLKSSGAMATGWQKIGGTWYYLKSSGAMATGWQKIGGAWYYLKSSGAMATGWQKIGGKWYYLKSSGAMATGWQKIGGTWYYLNGSGVMVTGRVTIGGKRYRFSSSGAWIG